MTASIDEQIARKRAAADKQAARAAALKKELRDLERKKAAAERKARTHRLVEVGAILEQAAGMAFDTEDLRRALSEVLNEQTADMDKNGNRTTLGTMLAGACRTQIERAQQQASQNPSGGGIWAADPQRGINPITGEPM
jgi:hypothetical protein